MNRYAESQADGRCVTILSIPFDFFLARIVFIVVVLAFISADLLRAEQPLIQTKFGLFQQGLATLGLPSAEATNAIAYYATGAFAHYNHHPAIINFHNKFYLMWSSGIVDEDSSSQQITFATSPDGEHWSPWKVFAADPDGPAGPMRRTAGGWWIANDTLYASFATHYGTIEGSKPSAQVWAGDCALEFTSSSDGVNWSSAQPMINQFMPNEAPRWDGKYWIITGEDNFGVSKVLYTSDPSGVHDWRRSILPPDLTGKEPNEPSWFRRSDGSMIMIFRDDNRSRRLFASLSTNAGVSWSRPQKTGFADVAAKVRAGNLPDGEAYIINNPNTNPNGVRIPLVISISRDGLLFDRSYTIRSEPTHMRFGGLNKSDGYSYPSSVIFGDSLYVAYSINKEDIAVSRIPLSRIEEQ